jgi:hypothetical protein
MSRTRRPKPEPLPWGKVEFFISKRDGRVFKRFTIPRSRQMTTQLASDEEAAKYRASLAAKSDSNSNSNSATPQPAPTSKRRTE